MHTLMMTGAGLVLLALFAGVAMTVKRPGWDVSRAFAVFIPVWLLIALANMVIGMTYAGIPFLTEVAVLAVVFGLPAAAAWAIRARA